MADLKFTVSASSQDFTKEMENVKSQTGNVKKQFRSLTQETNNLEVAYRKLSNEEKNSPFGKYLRGEIDKNIQKLADFKDTIGDVQQEVSKLASDTVVWDGLAEGIGVARDTVSAFATSLGISTKQGGIAANALNTLARAQTFANAAISIGNALQKNSKIMSAITTLQMRAQAAATNSCTVAQAAFNAVAKANPYVLLATAVIGVVTAFALFSDGADEATDAQEKLTLAEENGKKVSESYSNTLASEYSKLMTSYTKLKATWGALANDNQRKKFIQDHKRELKELGGEINNVSDAEKFFKGDTDRVVKAFEARATAAALAAKAAELYRQKMEIVEKAKDFLQNRGARAGEKVYEEPGIINIDKNGNTYNGGKYYMDNGVLKYTQKGADAANQATKEWKELDDAYKKNDDSIKGVTSQYADLIKKSGILNDFTNTNTSSVDKHTTSVQKQITTYAEAISEYDRLAQEKEKLNKSLEEGRIAPEFKEDFKKEIAGYDTKIQELVDKWHIKAKVELEKPQDTNISEINKVLADALNPEKSGSSNYNFSGLNNFEELEQFKTPAEEVISSMKRIEEARKKLEDIKSNSNPWSEDYAHASDALEQLNNKYDELSQKADVYQNLSNEADNLAEHNENVKETLEAVGDSLNSIGSIFSSLGKLTDNKLLDVTGIIAQAVANYVLGWTEATAKAAKLGPIGWAAFGLSTAAQVFAMISQIKSVAKFAEGGIIGGNSYYGDKILARVNSGEVILNKRQQQRAYELMDNGMSGLVVTGDVKIKGSDLYLSLKNYGKVQSGIGKNIGIK